MTAVSPYLKLPLRTEAEIRAERALGKAQIKALKQLGPPGHLRVNWRPNLSPDGYRKLLEGGYIEEFWTWASTTRPDVGITDKGVAALTSRYGVSP